MPGVHRIAISSSTAVVLAIIVSACFSGLNTLSRYRDWPAQCAKTSDKEAVKNCYRATYSERMAPVVPDEKWAFWEFLHQEAPIPGPESGHAFPLEALLPAADLARVLAWAIALLLGAALMQKRFSGFAVALFISQLVAVSVRLISAFSADYGPSLAVRIAAGMEVAVYVGWLVLLLRAGQGFLAVLRPSLAVLWRARFVVALLILYNIVIATDQFRDVFTSLATPEASLSAFLGSGLFLLFTMQAWLAAGWLIRLPPQSEAARRLANWPIRILVAATVLWTLAKVVEAAAIEMGSLLDTGWLYPGIVMFTASFLALVLVPFCYWIAVHPEISDRERLRRVSLLCLAAIHLGIAFFLWSAEEIAVLNAPGPLGLLCAAGGFLLAILTGTDWALRRVPGAFLAAAKAWTGLSLKSAPAVTFILLIIVVSNFAYRKLRGADYGSVHEFGAQAAGNSDLKIPFNLEAYWKEWYAQANRCADCKVEHNGRTVLPVVFISSSGGGLRAAAWTNLVLFELIRQRQGGKGNLTRIHPQNIFLLSGVSGGAVGLSIFQRLWPVLEHLPEKSAEKLIEAIFRNDYLSPLMAGLFFKEIPYWVIPVQPKADRARYHELAFEVLLADACKLVGLENGLNSRCNLAEGLHKFRKANPYAPILIRNAADARSGWRVVVSELQTSCLAYSHGAAKVLDNIQKIAIGCNQNIDLEKIIKETRSLISVIRKHKPKADTETTWIDQADNLLDSGKCDHAGKEAFRDDLVKIIELASACDFSSTAKDPTKANFLKRDPLLAAAIDLADVRPIENLRLSTAALLAARFPFVSPSGVVTHRDKILEPLHLVDGGYFDNTGAASALPVLERVKILAEGKDVFFIYIHIENDNIRIDSKVSDFEFLPEFTIPAHGLLWTWQYHSIAALAEIKRQQAEDSAPHCPGYTEFNTFETGTGAAPLGWFLSGSAFRNLKGQREAVANKKAFERFSGCIVPRT